MDYKEIDQALRGRIDYNAREYWNMRAPGFREMSVRNIVTEDSLIGRWQKSRKLLDKDSRVLDVGCGAGRYADYLAGQAGYYLGVDISDQMIAFAQEDRGHIANADFKVHDWTQDPEDQIPGKYDLVFAAMSGALNSLEALKKFVSYSSKYCLVERFVRDRNSLEFLVKDLTGKDICRRGHNSQDYILGLLAFIMKEGYTPEIISEGQSKSRTFALEDIETAYGYVLSQLEDEERSKVLESLAQGAKDGLVQIDHRSDRISILWTV